MKVDAGRWCRSQVGAGRMRSVLGGEVAVLARCTAVPLLTFVSRKECPEEFAGLAGWLELAGFIGSQSVSDSCSSSQAL